MTTRQTAGITLLHDFGGEGPLVHLAHANGFPPGSYRVLAETLLPDYHVLALPSRPLWPGSPPSGAPTWHPMATDLEKDLEAVGARNVLGVGHSLGGVLTLWASIHRPHLFRAIVLVDPVILPVSQLRMLRLLNFVGLGRRHALVQRTLRRRQEWPSRQACFDHLRGKPLFDLWSDTALLDYVHYGTRARDDGSVELTYPPAWEAQIFATPPTGIWRDLRQVQVPCLFIRGELSSTFRAESLRRIGRLLPRASLVTLPGGGHLLPMEIPQAVGAAIRRFFDGLAPS